MNDDENSFPINDEEYNTIMENLGALTSMLIELTSHIKELYKIKNSAVTLAVLFAQTICSHVEAVSSMNNDLCGIIKKFDQRTDYLVEKLRANGIEP